MAKATSFWCDECDDQVDHDTNGHWEWKAKQRKVQPVVTLPPVITKPKSVITNVITKAVIN